MADIKITVRAKTAAHAPLVRARPRRSAPTPTLSPLPQDPRSHRRLSEAEARFEVRVAYAIIAEAITKLGLDPTNVNIPVTHHHRFTRRMGDARAFSFAWVNITGRIRLSSSALWRRASPEERRDTVLHELCHVLANCHAERNVGHRREWKEWMVKLGLHPRRCHSINLDGLRRRRRSS